MQPVDVEANATLAWRAISHAYMLPWAAHVAYGVIQMSLLGSDQLVPLVRVDAVFLILCIPLFAPRLAVGTYVWLARRYVTRAPPAAPLAPTNALGELYKDSADTVRHARHVLEPLLQFLPLPPLAWTLYQ